MEQWKKQLSNEFIELIHKALTVLQVEMGLEKNAASVDRYRSLKTELEALESAYLSKSIDVSLPCLNVVTLLGLYDSMELSYAMRDVNLFYCKYLSRWKSPGSPK